jgi:glutamate racemase
MNPAASNPIGIFDSGLGGLTVLKEIMALLPGENTVYFGDSGRAPYGTKSAETVIKFSRQNVRFLLDKKVKIIVIACNTASSCAYDIIRQESDIPVIEVVRPGAAAAANTTRNGRIGVIGTRGTVASEVYIRAINAEARPGTLIFQQACPLFVGLAEEGWWDHPVTRLTAKEYLAPLVAREVDTLVLGCTHYPLLQAVIADTMGSGVELVNAGKKVAAQVRQALLENGLLRTDPQPAGHSFYTSDSIGQFRMLGGTFLGQAIDNVQRIDIEKY